MEKKKQDSNQLQVPKPRKKQTFKRQRGQGTDQEHEPLKKRRHTEQEQKTIHNKKTTIIDIKTDAGSKENMTDRKVTIQTKEGQYEATLRVDNINNCPMQGKLGPARYRISEPPRMMHNIPKYHTTKQIQNGQVLKFDISRPDPGRQLWNRRQEERGGYTQDCIAETTEEIQEKETTITQNKTGKGIEHLPQNKNRVGNTED